MWSIIEEDKIDTYIDKYPVLKEDKDIFLLHNNNGKVFLPRFFFKNFPSKFIQVYEPKYEPERINLTFDGQPRPNQLPLINNILGRFDKDGCVNGIIKCFCGFGKTACSIYLATKLGYKTLFIVDKDSLFKQWIQEIAKFTNINPDDIGVIKGKCFKVENKPFVIATVQTLLSKVKSDAKKAYEMIKEAGFGLTIFDEVHNTSASKQFSKSSILISSPNILGLSATPFKPGGQDILMKNVIGEILHEETDYKTLPDVYFHYYQSGLQKYKFMMCKMDFIAAKAFYNKVILSSESYLKLIQKLVKNDFEEGHRIIIICWTEKQLLTISDKLNEIGIEHIQFYGKKREFTKDDKVLVATYKYCGTGKSKPVKNKKNFIYKSFTIISKC